MSEISLKLIFREQYLEFFQAFQSAFLVHRLLALLLLLLLLLTLDHSVLAGYVAPQNIFTRLYNEVRENWATATTNWISFWQRMSGLFFAEAPAMEEEEEVKCDY